MKKTLTTIIIALLISITSFLPTSLSEETNDTPLIQPYTVEGLGYDRYVSSYYNNSYDGWGTNKFDNIKDAINIANDSDIIYVGSGEYNGFFVINKSITLISENKESTIIDGSLSTPLTNSLINITADNVTISGFTIKNGKKREITIEDTNGIPAPPYELLYNGIGVQILSNNNQINNNNIENNEGYGIFLDYSQNTILSNNNITGHTQACIYLKNSNNNTITNNTITNNERGIIFHIESTDNILYYNNFINNTYYHAHDESNNTWYNEELKHGNYWDDYNGTDKNNDGIGDTQYSIEGNTSIDKYPLMSLYTGEIDGEFVVDEGTLYFMLVVSLIVATLFLLPIAYIWYRKTRHLR